MLDALKQKFKEEAHKEVKSNIFSQHLNLIERLCKSIKETYPDIDLNNIVTKLSDMAEKSAEQYADSLLSFQEQVENIVKAEIDAYKQIKVAA